MGVFFNLRYVVNYPTFFCKINLKECQDGKLCSNFDFYFTRIIELFLDTVIWITSSK